LTNISLGNETKNNKGFIYINLVKMTTILKKILCTFMFVMFGLIGLSPFNLAMAQSGQSPYNDALNKTLSDKSLRSVAITDMEDGR
jgi:D-alanyl-lipoteichoic acid acyltransferase DltB (MBOAT superfamily)